MLMNPDERRGEAVPSVKVIGNKKTGTIGQTRAFFQDLIEGARLSQVWTAFAWAEIKNRYRRSVVGLGWISLSFLLFCTAISIFFGAFSDLQSREFIAYAAFGFAAFQFIMSNVVDGCSVFSTSSGWINSMSLPYSIYVYKRISRGFFPFVIHMATALLLLPLVGWRPTPSALLFFPALAFCLFVAVPVQYTFGLLAARSRDVQHLVAALARLFFFTTPIIWVYSETTGLRRDLADFNPMTHFVQILRQPLLGEPIDPTHWIIALLWGAAAWIVAIGAGTVMRRRLPFWV